MSPLRRILWLTFLMLPMAANAAERKPYVSWGKEGVSFEQYRANSIECGRAGAGRDLERQQAVKDVIHGAHFQDSALDRGDAVEYAMIYDRNFRANVPKVQAFMASGVEECLLKIGYVPFALTQAQENRLSAYKKGSPERFHYLHELSVDPKVLREQRLDLGQR
jgi:hypothetical protein